MDDDTFIAILAIPFLIVVLIVFLTIGSVLSLASIRILMQCFHEFHQWYLTFNF